MAVQGVDREDDAGQTQVTDQSPHALDLRGRVPHLPVAEDEAGLGGEGAEHVRRGAVVQAKSKLRRSVLPSSATTRGPSSRAASPRGRA